MWGSACLYETDSTWVGIVEIAHGFFDFSIGQGADSHFWADIQTDADVAKGLDYYACGEKGPRSHCGVGDTEAVPK